MNESPEYFEVTATVTVPARCGRAVQVAAGQRFSIVDIVGAQVADLFVFAASDPDEFHSASHTRMYTSRLFPRPGEYFYSNFRRPMLKLIRDTSLGYHDMLIAACDQKRYKLLGQADHASCTDNFHSALASIGLTKSIVPQPINVFMNIAVTHYGDIAWESAVSEPGQLVTFEALIDCVIVASACPQDLNDINGRTPTAIGIEVLSRESVPLDGATQKI